MVLFSVLLIIKPVWTYTPSIFYSINQSQEYLNQNLGWNPGIPDIKSSFLFRADTFYWEDFNKIVINTNHANFNDIVMHEYSHYVMDEIYPINPTACKNKGSFNTESGCLEEPFMEGWADAFSMGVRDEAKHRHLIEKNSPYKTDEFRLEEKSELESDLAKYNATYKESPRTDATVAMILWDVIDDKSSLDNSPDEDDDFIYNEDQKFLKVINEDKPNNIIEFYENWMSRGYDYTQYQNELYDIYQKQGITNLLNDWTTYCHDQKRSCSSSMKSDIDSANSDKVGWESTTTGYYDHPLVVDVLDSSKRNKRSELIVEARQYIDIYTTIGKIYLLENTAKEGALPNFEHKWDKDITLPTEIYGSHLVSDLDLDGNKEISFISKEGILYIIDAKTGSYRENNVGRIKDIKGQWTLPADFSSGRFVGMSSADIDNDDVEELLFATRTGYATLYWNGLPLQNYLFVYDPIDRTLSKVPLNNTSGGSPFQLSIADLDDDDYMDIVVANSYGIQIFEYDLISEDIELRYENSDGLITGPVVISDIDKDGEYELIYITRDDSSCASGKTCQTKLYVRKADLSAEEETNLGSYYPHSNPAVANILGDSKLEILEVESYDEYFSTSGIIKCYDYQLNPCSGWTASTQDIDYSSPVLFDIGDEDEYSEALIVTVNGVLKLLDNDGSTKWSQDLGDFIGSRPAIGDWDGDGLAEIAIKYYSGSTQSMWSMAKSIEPGSITDAEAITMNLQPLKILNSGFSPGEPEYLTYGYIPMDATGFLTILDGLNKKPSLEYIEPQYFIAGNYITINASATDYNNDPLSYSYSSPFNNTDTQGYWQTNSTNDGTYEIYLSVSDGNLTDSQYINVNIFREDTEKITKFNDSEQEKELIFNETYLETERIYVNLSNQSRIWYADFSFNGLPLITYNESFQETNPSVIQANEINNSYQSDKLVDKNWSSYYSAGILSGAIVEIQNLTIPYELGHVIFHLKVKHDGNGNGRFGVYNYKENYYEIITSIIPSTNNTEDIYFDIYDNEESVLWIGNTTYYTMQVNNISNYINQSSNSSRWYYRYINGNYSNQLIYESEIKLKEKETYPKDLIIKVNNTIIVNGTGEIISNNIHLTEFSDGAKNISFDLSNSSETIYVRIPKNSEVMSGYIRFGNHTTLDLNMTKVSKSIIILNEKIPTKITKLSNLGLPGFFKTKFPDNYSLNVSYEDMLNFCIDWTYYADNAIDRNKYGPYCADSYSWHVLDVDNDTYNEWYMLKGETYITWAKCYAESGYTISKFEFDGVNEECWDGDCDEYVEQTYWNNYYGSTASTIYYPNETCYANNNDLAQWPSGILFRYWDENTNGEYDEGEHTEDYLVLECGETDDCADDKYCDDKGNNNSMDNTCSYPSCSPSCYAWESETYANHSCSCNLTAGRCDTTNYGWQNVNESEYCDDNHYPSTTQRINCSVYETWSIENHTETCTLTEGRCNTSNTQLDWKYYCSEDYWIREINVEILINNTATKIVPKTDVIEIDVSNEIQEYLLICDPDEQGNCLIPITFNSEFNANFDVVSIDINYELNRINFTGILQENLLSNCIGVCDIPIEITSSDGKIEIDDLRIFNGPQNEPNLMDTTTIEAYESQTLKINATDPEDDVLEILSDISQFIQEDNSIEWTTNSTDSGSYTVKVNVSDGLQMDERNYTIIVKDTTFVDQFSDNTSEKSLVFNVTDLEIVSFRIEKEAEIINSMFFVESIQLNGTYPRNVTISLDNQILINESQEFNYSYIIQDFAEEINSSLISCTADEDGYCLINISVYAEPNGTINLSNIEIYYIVQEDIYITNLSQVYSNIKSSIFEIIIENPNSETLENINWSLDTGESKVYSSYLFNLSSQQKAVVYVDNLYSDFGNYNVTAEMFNDKINYSVSLNVSIQPDVSIENLNLIYNSSLNVIYEFIIENKLEESVENVSWNFNTGDSLINSTMNINLDSQKKAYIYIDYNYSSSDTYEAIANVTYNGVSDTYALNITI